MLITDKMIKDIKCSCCYSEICEKEMCLKNTKIELKKIGYEVEKSKSKLEQATDIYNIIYRKIVNRKKITIEDINSLAELYEQTIKELQDQLQKYENKIIANAIVDNLK
jgi:hypothetical protein